MIGTAGALMIGHNPRANRVEIYDASGIRNECTPSFFDRFEEAFLCEAREFVAAVQGGMPSGAALGDAVEATRIGVAMRESMLSGMAVML